MYDCIVIGKGPAGISCAVYLKRFNYNVLVIGKDEGVLGNNTIENYYGFSSIKGKELSNLGIEQAKALGIEILTEEVLEIDDKKVVTKNKTYEAKALFLAMGKKRKKEIKNIDNYDHISYCAICDGFFYRKKKIGLVGSDDFMKRELEILKRFTDDITVFSNGEECDIDCVKEKIVGIYGEKEFEGVETDKQKYALDGLFIATGATAFALGKHLGLEMKEENIVVKNYMTNIKGIFAGGDVIGGVMQISKAVYDGMMASMEIKKYLENKDN